MRKKYSTREQVTKMIYDVYMKYKKKVERVCENEFSKEIIKTYREIITWHSERIQDIFNDAVDTFYSSYEPNLYNRRGDPSSHSGGLYELLSIRTDEDGTGILMGKNYMGLFDESRMHGDRHGGSLFNKVFVEGWHGGAESGQGHPKPGTPYWRSPAPDYTKWYKPAKRAKKNERAYSIIVKKLNDMERGGENSEVDQKYYDVSKKHFDVAIQKIIKKI